MTSQIAGVDMLHILGSENTYMKSVQNPGLMQNPYNEILQAKMDFFYRKSFFKGGRLPAGIIRGGN